MPPGRPAHFPVGTTVMVELSKLPKTKVRAIFGQAKVSDTHVVGIVRARKNRSRRVVFEAHNNVEVLISVKAITRAQDEDVFPSHAAPTPMDIERDDQREGFGDELSVLAIGHEAPTAQVNHVNRGVDREVAQHLKAVVSCGLGCLCLNRVEGSGFDTAPLPVNENTWHKCSHGLVIHNLCAQALGFEGEFKCNEEIADWLAEKKRCIASFDKEILKWVVVSEEQNRAAPASSKTQPSSSGPNMTGLNADSSSSTIASANTNTHANAAVNIDSSSSSSINSSPSSNSGANLGNSGVLQFDVGAVAWKEQFRSVDTRTPLSRGIRARIEWPDGGDGNRSPMQYFKHFFLTHLVVKQIIKFTNQRLELGSRAPMDQHEFFKFLGLLVLSTRYNIGIDALWESNSNSIVEAPDFGKWGVSKSRFRHIVANLAFIEIARDPKYATGQANEFLRKVQFKGKTVLVHTWGELGGLIKGFNEARGTIMEPGSVLVVDECMSKWKGKENRRIEGAPHISKIARKPEPIGVEIMMICDAQSGIAQRIELKCSQFHEPREFEHENLKGTAVVQRLANDFKASGRTVLGDSAFSSVNTCLRLSDMGLFYIGPVKTATSRFPREQLQSHSYSHHGASIFLTAEMETPSGNPIEVFATGWNDGKIKTMVSTCGTSQPGKPHEKHMWKNPDGALVSVTANKTIPRDATTAEYHTSCGAVDYHNSFRQGFLALERIRRTKRWQFRVFCTIFGMCVTDAFFAYRHFSSSTCKDFQSFLMSLAADLLNNTKGGPNYAADNNLDQESYRAQHNMKSIATLPRKTVNGKSVSICGVNPQKRCMVPGCKSSKKQGRRVRSSRHCEFCTSKRVKVAGLTWETMTAAQVFAVCQACVATHVLGCDDDGCDDE
ncbi:DDE_Tnp_1_7 domain-containing protein [Durusdinium trenchii]|uniref:DDE_Tnp_1_7 domain-containing protein n=1 Tax=Durusdinium trenchii TaxID=1381693 RepID=A0ABP0L5H3_9DINO